jgi:hypothetical protein
MRASVQARLDRESRRALTQLVQRLSWSPSRVVREGLRLLAACQGGHGGKKIVGLGKFSSGIRDLGSNKTHLKGFGR